MYGLLQSYMQPLTEALYLCGALYTLLTMHHCHVTTIKANTVNKLTTEVKRNQKHKFYNLQKHPIKASPTSAISR